LTRFQRTSRIAVLGSFARAWVIADADTGLACGRSSPAFEAASQNSSRRWEMPRRLLSVTVASRKVIKNSGVIFPPRENAVGEFRR